MVTELSQQEGGEVCVCVTCVSMQRGVWSWQGGGGAGRHNQALPVARPTAEERKFTF